MDTDERGYPVLEVDFDAWAEVASEAFEQWCLDHPSEPRWNYPGVIIGPDPSPSCDEDDDL